MPAFTRPTRTPHPSVVARRAARRATYEAERTRVLQLMSQYRTHLAVALYRLTCARTDYWRLRSSNYTTESITIRARIFFRHMEQARHEVVVNEGALRVLDNYLSDITMTEEDAAEGAEVADFINELLG